VEERHRHRYEVNPAYIDQIEEGGLRFSGRDEKGERMEICELGSDIHPFFFGTQFHPELTSRIFAPSPPFLSLISGIELWLLC